MNSDPLEKPIFYVILYFKSSKNPQTYSYGAFKMVLMLILPDVDFRETKISQNNISSA